MEIISHPNGIQTVVNVIEPEQFHKYSTYIDLLIKHKVLKYETEYKSYSKYGEVVGETLLLFVQPIVEKVAKCKLYPTYSFTRKYLNGAELPIHTDREACEVSCTFTLDYEASKPWPIYVVIDGQKIEVPLESGQMMWYKGCDTPHGRNTFDGNYSTHCFLHFVKAKGKNDDYKYDKRQGITADNLFLLTLDRRLKSLQLIEDISFKSKFYIKYDWQYILQKNKRMVVFDFGKGLRNQIVVPFFLEDVIITLLKNKGSFLINDFVDHTYAKAILPILKQLVLYGILDLH